MIETQHRISDTGNLPPDSNANGTVTSLVTGILEDAHKLVRQQFEMLIAEVHEDFQKSKRAAEYGGLGVVLLTVGIMGFVTAIAFFLHDEFQLSMWVSWAITSGIFILLGIALAITSYVLLERFSPLPKKTFQALQENLQWKTK
jgi:uncharacterized membrane protein YqjE